MTIPQWIIFTADNSAVAAITPYDLAEAIMVLAAQQSEALSDFSAIYKDQAGTRVQDSYLTYEIQRGTLAYYSSTSAWHDDRVTFKAWSSTGEQASRLLAPIRTVFDGKSLTFETGATSVFVESNRGSGKGPGRGVNATYQYFAFIEFSVQNRTGVPA